MQGLIEVLNTLSTPEPTHHRIGSGWLPPPDLPYNRRTWNRSVAWLLGAALAPLVVMAGGVLVLAAGEAQSALRGLAVVTFTIGLVLLVPAVFRVVGGLVDQIELQDLRLGKLDRGLRRASHLASSQQLGLLLLGQLRDRLASISSRLSLAATSECPQHREAKPMHRLADEVESCADLVDRYEKLARVREGSVLNLPLDVDDVIDTVLSLLHWEFYLRRIEVVRERSPHLPLAQGDPAGLRQVFQHLLLNAIQAVEQDGSIRVITDATQTTVRVAVIDSGPGIPAEMLDRVFEPLFTTHSGGIGLGLTVCRDLVSHMGGSVTAGNDPQAGAKITVTLRAEFSGPES